MAIKRFAAAGGSGSSSWIRAGKSAADEAAGIFETATAYGNDYGGMARSYMDSQSSQRQAATKAQTAVYKQGLAASAQVQSTKVTTEADKYVNEQKVKTKMAGKLAAYAGTLAKGFQKDEPPAAPILVDPQALADARSTANINAGLNPDGTPKTVATTTDVPETVATAPSTVQPLASGAPITFDSVRQLATNSGARFPELVAAQWQLETGGTSGQGPTANNNLFAQKGTDFTVDTQEHNGTSLQAAPGEGWQSYESPQAATDWLVNNWYQDSDRHGQGAESLGGGDLRQTAQSLNTLNYATDPEYGNKLIGILQQRGYL